MSDELAIDSGALIFATLADVYLSSGMYDEAISILKDGLSRNPNYALAKVILGRAYYLKGDVGEAVKILEEVYAQAKDSENTVLHLGHCYRKLGDNERAIQFYETVLKINSGNKEAAQELQSLKAGSAASVVEAESKEAESAPMAKPVEVPAAEKAEVEKPVEVPAAEKAEVEKPVEVLAAEKAEVEEPVEALAVGIPSSASAVDTLFAPAESTAVFPLERLNEPMLKLLNLKTVKGALICSRDGLPIMNYYPKITNLEELCAFIAAIHNESQNALHFIEEGDIDRFIIEKSNETICVIPVGESLLTVITKPEAKPGLIFVYARKIIDDIREILG